MPRWTAEQSAAIDARGENLLLAAAAGSGKTTVMVERILSLIREGAGIDEMLIVTFTRASAADMRAKLTEKLTALADTGSVHSREQLSRLESASISTIHAFCTSLLRTHFEAAGVDPSFRVLDEAENALCEEAAVDDAMEAAYVRMDEPLKHLNFGRGPKKVRELATELYHAVSDRPDPEGWMNAALQMAQGDGTAWLDTLAKAGRQCVRTAIAFTESAVRMTALPDGTPEYAAAMEKDLEELELMRNLGYDELRKSLADFRQSPIRAPRKPKGMSEWPPAVEALRTQTKEARDRAKREIAKAQKLLRFESAQAIADVHTEAEGMKALFDIVRDIARKHAARKAERSGLTFSDLEHRALALLRQPEIAAAVRKRYRYVFVDEYQDTSDVQEELVSRVAGENNRFMVGDVKQSIYRFRQAEPRLFLDCYRRYGAGEGGRLLALTRNFRSRPTILALTNRVFERVMQGGAAEIEYDRLARLNPGAVFEGDDPPVELILLAKKGLNEADDGADAAEDDELAELNHAEREAAVVIGRIRSLMAEQPDLRYRDIAILTRSGRNVIPPLLTALTDAGIPAYAEGSAGYFDAMEVQVFLAYLTLVENHRRDEAMIAVLRSPMQRISSPELALIRAEAREGSFSDAVNAYARHDNELGRRLRAFLTDLENDRILSRSMPLPRLFGEILRRTGFADSLLALPGGKQRKANLDRLSARAAQYEANQSGGLTGFLRYAERMRQRGDDEVAHTVGESEDVVRVMTVHKSKGLEFPVVFGIGLGRRFRTESGGEGVLTHPALGVGFAHVDEALSARRETVATLAIARKLQEEDRAEELRILYVLLTRAKHRLILVGGVSSAAAAMNLWRIGAEEPSFYNCALDVIMPALIDTVGGAEAIAPGGFGRLTLRDEFAADEANDGEMAFDGSSAIMPTEPARFDGNAGASAGNFRGFAADIRLHWLEEDKIRPVEPSEQKRRKDIAQALLEAADGVYQPEYRDEALLTAMAWTYPRERDVKKPLKLTASGLLRELEGPDVLPELAARPKFLTEEGLNGAERGSAIHAAMQNLNYDGLRRASPVQLSLLGEVQADTSRTGFAATRREILRQLDDMHARGILSRQMREAVPDIMLTRFFLSEAGRRILAAETVHREWPFNLRMDAADALIEGEREAYAGTMILVQGSIDLCFLENGKWVLMDYKTDRSTDIEEIKTHYKSQLKLYEKALERITGIPVGQTLLCLLRRNLIIDMA